MVNVGFKELGRCEVHWRLSGEGVSRVVPPDCDGPRTSLSTLMSLGCASTVRCRGGSRKASPGYGVRAEQRVQAAPATTGHGGGWSPGTVGSDQLHAKLVLLENKRFPSIDQTDFDVVEQRRHFRRPRPSPGTPSQQLQFRSS